MRRTTTTSFVLGEFSTHLISMKLGWFVVRKKVRRRRSRLRTKISSAHYLTHREKARAKVHERLTYWNTFYNFTYHRVAIRDQRTRWGSCSTKGNLNFNYRVLFLPTHLLDYVIVHELCHLKHFNHGKAFWAEMARTISDHESRRTELLAVSMYDLHKHTDVI